MADSLEIVGIRLAGWNVNENEETDHHTEYRVENLISLEPVDHVRLGNLCGDAVKLVGKLGARHEDFAALGNRGRRRHVFALGRVGVCVKVEADLVVRNAVKGGGLRERGALSRDPRGGRPPGALCRFLGVAEAPLTSTRRSSTSGDNEVTEYRDDDGSSIAV